MGEFMFAIERRLARLFGQRQHNGFYLWRGRLYP